MKRYLIFLGFLFLFDKSFAQEADTTTATSEWEGSALASFYFMEDDFFVLPIVVVEKGKLHLETRYNYESRETFSVWGGYNFSGGNKFEYKITPMAGIVAGEITGFAPGLEMTFNYHNFELYTESEYFIDPDPGDYDENFFYMWSDFTWSPLDWLWVGISGQRTRLFQSDVELQKGFFVGGGYKSFELSGYLYNPGGDDMFGIASLTWYF